MEYTVLHSLYYSPILTLPGDSYFFDMTVNLARRAYLLVILTAVWVFIAIAHQQYVKSIEWWDWDDYTDLRTASEAHDKVIVMGKLSREDTDWVVQHLPE